MPSEDTIESWFDNSDDRDELTEEERQEIIAALKDLADATPSHFAYHEQMRREVGRLIN